ncbi:MAG: hypothetical protein JW940_14465 [Polyangiaceae bacterium]|nr:hypothetical protein [Polyangiaceae bacterium]
MTPKEKNTPSSVRESILGQLATDLGDHYFWLPRLFMRAGGWRWLVPWPFLFIINRRRRIASREHGSIWLTAVSAAALLAGPERLQAMGSSHAAESARILFAGSFLVITMLSLSVAVPGQATLRLVLAKNPLFAAEFVSPTLWAFLWGVGGGACMVFHASLVPGFKTLASVVALYAFAMETNAVLYTIRMYSFGLVLAARESAREGSDGSQ